jgi:hypothetical protein
MSSPELTEWLNQVITGTDLKNIEWKQLNPTTYSWEQPGKPGRVILQRVERVENYQAGQGRIGQRKLVQFLLQVFELPNTQNPVITLNGAVDQEVNTQLARLYDIIASAMMRENLDFLKSLLPGPH